MIVIASALALSLSAFFLVKNYKSQPFGLNGFYWPGLFIRLCAGVGMGLVYTYYYSVGDTFGFFSDSLKISNLYEEDWVKYLQFLWAGDESHELANQLINVQVRSLFLVKTLSVLLMLSFKNYWIASLYFSSLAFLGSWFLVSKIDLYYPKAKRAAIISFLVLPSFVFWSSGIVKESLAIGALMFLAGAFLVVIQNGKLNVFEIFIGIISLYFLWSLKYYWAVLFIPANVTTLLVIKLKSRVDFGFKKWIEFPIWVTVFCVIILLASTIHPNFYLSRLLTIIVDNHDVYSQFSIEKPFVHFSNLAPTWPSIISNSPWALFSGLFRPMIFEGNTAFQFIIGSENLILLGLLLFNLKYLSRYWSSPQRLLIFSIIVYVALLAIFLTLSTPNFGTLSRYRIGFLPFIFFILLYLPLSTEKILKI